MIEIGALEDGEMFGLMLDRVERGEEIDEGRP